MAEIRVWFIGGEVGFGIPMSEFTPELIAERRRAHDDMLRQQAEEQEQQLEKRRAIARERGRIWRDAASNSIQPIQPRRLTAHSATNS